MSGAKEAALRHVEAFNSHNLEALGANETQDVEWVAPGGIVLRGPDQVKSFQKVYWDAFPDAQVVNENQIVADPYVITEGAFTGTHSGTFRTPSGDIPATGLAVKVRYCTIQRIEDGLVASEHLYFDQAEMLGQLGLLS